MADQDIDLMEQTPNDVSRRNFIKGVIAAGAAVSSAALCVPGQPAARRSRRRAPGAWSG